LSAGIGHAIAKRLARDGFAVVVNYSGNTREAEAAVDGIKSAGGETITLQADVSNPAEGFLSPSTANRG
jgi:3-oxoacyl-[acyl-carrier protein] reductase